MPWSVILLTLLSKSRKQFVAAPDQDCPVSFTRKSEAFQTLGEFHESVAFEKACTLLTSANLTTHAQLPESFDLQSGARVGVAQPPMRRKYRSRYTAPSRRQRRRGIGYEGGR